MGDEPPPSDPFGPQQLRCIYCWPRRADDGSLLLDEHGRPIRNCARCIARGTDRWCECTWCDWL